MSGTLEFSLAIADIDINDVWSAADSSEHVILELSTDGGVTYNQLAKYDHDSLASWTDLSVSLPDPIIGSKYRWRQLSYTFGDHWAIDNIVFRDSSGNVIASDNFESETTSSLFSSISNGVVNTNGNNAPGNGTKSLWFGGSSGTRLATTNPIGNRKFGPERIITTDARHAESVYAADLDGDGDNDVRTCSTLDYKEELMKRLPRSAVCGMIALLIPVLMGSVANSSHVRERLTQYQVIEQSLVVDSSISQYVATYTKQATQHDVLPSQALILGVPFTSWEEASRLNYLSKDILNPSWAATTSMVLQYWGEGTDKLQDRESLLSWASWEDGKAQSLDEIKPWLAQNIPVMVTTGLTPTAHPLYSTAHVLASGGFFPEALIEPRGPSSWMLGSMVAYDVFQQIEEFMNVNFVRESVVLSTRVVVGYDDAREIVILHDPRFGAAWEVSYKDFEAMWAATDRFYSVAYPANYVEVLNQLPLGLGYSSRTSDQQAAEHYVLGYALGIVGDTNEAAEHFRQGLAISGISQGYKHLLQFELAVQLFSWQGTPDETLTALQKAIDLLPENPAPWAYLAHVYDHIGWTQEEARDAKQKANQLCNSQEARSKVFEVLPADLQLFFLPC